LKEPFPVTILNNGLKMPLVGLGTFKSQNEVSKIELLRCAFSKLEKKRKFNNLVNKSKKSKKINKKKYISFLFNFRCRK
jgi:hypothetical protein